MMRDRNPRTLVIRQKCALKRLVKVQPQAQWVSLMDRDIPDNCTEEDILYWCDLSNRASMDILGAGLVTPEVSKHIHNMGENVRHWVSNTQKSYLN